MTVLRGLLIIALCVIANVTMASNVDQPQDNPKTDTTKVNYTLFNFLQQFYVKSDTLGLNPQTQRKKED